MFTISFPCSDSWCRISIYYTIPIPIVIVIVIVSIDFGTSLLIPTSCVDVATVSDCVDSEVVAIVVHAVVVVV